MSTLSSTSRFTRRNGTGGGMDWTPEWAGRPPPTRERARSAGILTSSSLSDEISITSDTDGERDEVRARPILRGTTGSSGDDGVSNTGCGNGEILPKQCV